MPKVHRLQTDPGIPADRQMDHAFFCPGCKCGHGFNAQRWAFNGDLERPTLNPSLLLFGVRRCHSFVRDGMIEFLADCDHELAGKTVPLEDF
jgi:hypothetical protein